MRRIIALSLILVTISGLALAEVATEEKYKPKGYVVNIGSDKFVIITPLDKGHSVLISRIGSKDQYLVEGILARSVAKCAKMIAGKPSQDRTVAKFVKDMVSARQFYLAGEKAIVSIASKSKRD